MEQLPQFPPPLQAKIDYSINLLRKAEKLALTYDKEDGYYLAFSGGKDSQALYHLAVMAGVKFRAHMNLTSVDPPEVIRFVRRQYPDCVMHAPQKSIFTRAVERGLLPTMRVRWCCYDFKEMAGAGKVTLIGIRRTESARRARRSEVEISGKKYSGTLEGLEGYRDKLREKRKRKLARMRKAERISIINAEGENTVSCIGGKETLIVSPIIHWTEQDVWDFLNLSGIAHCELYDQGFRRIGCIGCPMSNPKQKQREAERWPHVKRNWIKAIRAIRRGGYCQENLHRGG